jgi:hypothetical protein
VPQQENDHPPRPYQDATDFLIPEAELNRWVAIDIETLVGVTLRRGDFDRFFFMNMQIASALDHLQQSVTLLSNGETAPAQLHMNESKRLVGVHMGNVRAFMAAIMAHAVPFAGENS